jgi:DNA end-binding protein Ku
VVREHEYLVAIRPYQDVLALQTMFFPDEVRDPKDVAKPPKNVRVAERELEMATRLIDSLTTEFDPSRYRDTHRERVLDVIKRKAKGEEIVAEAPEEEDAKVIDLMEVLRASIENAGKRTKKAAKTTANKATKKATKKTTKKATKATKKSARKTAAKRRAS